MELHPQILCFWDVRIRSVPVLEGGFLGPCRCSIFRPTRSAMTSQVSSWFLPTQAKEDDVAIRNAIEEAYFHDRPVDVSATPLSTPSRGLLSSPLRTPSLSTSSSNGGASSSPELWMSQPLFELPIGTPLPKRRRLREKSRVPGLLVGDRAVPPCPAPGGDHQSG